jgi:hypothetical protein
MKKDNKEFNQENKPSDPMDTDSLENEYLSRPKKSPQWMNVLLFLLLFLSVLAIGFYLYTKKSSPEYSNFDPNATTLEKLNFNPEYLEEENLLRIKGQLTIDYLQTRLLYYKYETNDNPTKGLLEELNRDFNGERALVLSDILKTWIQYLEEKKKLDSDEELSGYKKYIQSKALRVKIFGEELEPYLFPEKPEDRIETYFLYSKQYLKNHREDDPLSKKDHLLKAKKEIYGDLFEDLIRMEPIPSKLELELGLIEREMSILTEQERKVKIESLREKLRKGEL